MKTKNILLTLSLAAFAIGFSDLQENMLFWAGRPVGALLFGMYLIMLVLEDATALYDKQESEKRAQIGDKQISRTKNKEASAPALANALSR